MTRSRTTLLVMAIAACGTTAPPVDHESECASAIEHAYGVGCVYVESGNQEGVSEGEAVSVCVVDAHAASEQSYAGCDLQLEDWIECMAAAVHVGSNVECCEQPTCVIDGVIQ